ncbi:MAG TPA: amino acid adenylation domain-containing protein, partial [Thermoanaerobaculia bacterium]|nr:amino acid adenylation domain-containing protein [Thermoanaerobaculia bacterium]
GDFCLHRRFEQVAAARPFAPALTFEGETLSYGDLEARANRLARRLRAAGVGPETRVALCLERTFDLAVAILAVLKAGGAYVPLDPTYPAERLAFLLEDAEAPIVVTRGEQAAALPDSGARLFLLDRVDLSQGNAEPLAEGASPGNAAYVIYTSGSTGKPKGVVVTHESVARLFTATDPWFGFGPDDVWTLFHSYAFDFSVWEIWGALLYGGRLVIVPYALSRSPRAFRDLLAAERVTVLSQTPSAFHSLQRADEAAASGDGSDAPLSLRYVIFGGEALDLGALAPWFARYPEDRPRLVNMYGITETTVHVTYRPIGASDLRAGSVVGEPIPDLGIRLLDAHGSLVPLGVPGEIHVVGAGLARGYLARPALTAERFVPDGFSSRPGERSYRSGDLARWRPAPDRPAALDLEYLGRIDHQVKIRGFRIELGEIEAALAALPEVAQLVVVARSVAAGADPELVAYFVARGAADTAESAATALRAQLKERLPAYMVPAHFVPLDHFPVTPNGKIDRKALPDPVRAVRRAAEVPLPATEMERRVAAIWRDVLHVEGEDGLGIDVDFFDLGGHSLAALKVQAQLELALGRSIDFVVLWMHPTVRQLAAALAQEAEPAVATSGRKLASVLVPIQPAGTLPPLFVLPPAGGTVYFYRVLAQALGPDQPVWGIQSFGLEEGETPFQDIESAATFYLEAIAPVRMPGAPVHLAGASMGGLSVFEMARQLRARGEAVGMAALLDTARGGSGQVLDDRATMVAMVHMLTEGRFRIPPEQLLGLDPEQQLDLVLAEAAAQGISTEGVSREKIGRIRAVLEANLQAHAHYAHRTYDGPLLYCRA